MSDQLTTEERAELQRRRDIETVSDAVEQALRRRYTWVGVIVAIAAFVGSTLIIKAITADLEVQIAVGQETLKRIIQEADDAEHLSKTAQAKLASIDDSIDTRLNALDARIDEKSKGLDELFDARERNFANLDRTLASLDDLRARLDQLTTIVQSVVEATPERTSEAPQLAASLQDLKKEQTALGQELVATSQQVKLSQYSVYVHYADSEQAMSRKLGDFLKSAGFVVPDVRQVNQRSRSIRYFYQQDREGALAVQDSVKRFFSDQGVDDLELEIRDFTDYTGQKPRRGVIELWLFFS